MLLGAHVSIAGGIINAPKNASLLGCEVFQIFTRSPQGGKVPPLDKKTADDFKIACAQYQQKEWYVHTPYFINFASANKRIQYGSISTVRQELDRASLIGAKYLMTHLGSFKDLGKEAGTEQTINGLDEMLKDYQGTTQFLIEISAGAGAIIGSAFSEIAEIIHHKKLKKYDIGVCYDTQHGFASGYDIRTASALEKTLTEFDKTIGLKNLKMSHCNDSLTELNSNKDRHAHIGEGLIGLSGFKNWLKNKQLANINLILETPTDKVAEDIKILKKFRSN